MSALRLELQIRESSKLSVTYKRLANVSRAALSELCLDLSRVRVTKSSPCFCGGVLSINST